RGQIATISDPLTGDAAGEEPKSGFTKIKVNNSLRRTIRDMISGLTLASPDPIVRLVAARTMFVAPDAGNLGALDAAIAKETVASVKASLEAARASTILVSDAPDAAKLDAIALLGQRGDRDTLSLLTGY